MKLSYDKVFDRYAMSFSDKLAEISYSLYRKIRLSLTRYFPLSEHEKYQFNIDPFSKKEACDMPKGFDYRKSEETEGFLKLDYIDFYDYLPKEDLSYFIKELKKCASRNKINSFSIYCTQKDIDKIHDLGYYSDRPAFSNILSIPIQKNKHLQRECTSISISLYNLSTTFLVIKYRIYISKSFNSKIQKICKEKYTGYTTVYRQFNTPWYAIKKFGRTSHTGNDVRREKLYKMISQLKWQILKEIRKSFTVHFWKDKMFPPTFETYSTNIRPINERTNVGFWNSVMFENSIDYAPNYNICVCWDYNHSNNEGARLAAYCGDNYTKENILPGIIHHDISDKYAVYLTATTLRIIAERNTAMCNKNISKAIRKAKTSLALKVRVDVERKLYYSYRFISEFTKKSIKFYDVKEFKNEFYKKGSISSRSFKGVSKSIKESKLQIDNILKLLNNAAEYRSSKSNIKLQWIMMFITVLSLFVALLSINNHTAINVIKSILKWMKNMWQ